MRNNARRKCKAFSLRSKIWSPRVGNQIWASTPQNCATTHRVCFEKRWYLQETVFVVRRFIACLRKFYVYATDSQSSPLLCNLFDASLFLNFSRKYGLTQ